MSLSILPPKLETSGSNKVLWNGIVCLNILASKPMKLPPLDLYTLITLITLFGIKTTILSCGRTICTSHSWSSSIKEFKCGAASEREVPVG